MRSDDLEFLLSKLTLKWAPEHPLADPKWTGAAFDRNVDNWAPLWFWDAFLKTAAEAGDKHCWIGEADALRRDGTFEFDEVELSWQIIWGYLDHDFRFVRDRVIWSRSSTWAVVMDQDVTLFAGSKPFFRTVIANAGGIEVVERKVYEDFGVAKGGNHRLNTYVERLAAGWA